MLREEPLEIFEIALDAFSIDVIPNRDASLAAKG